MEGNLMNSSILYSEGAIGLYLGLLIAGLPALINFVGNIINLKFDEKKLNAEIIVKARMK